MNCPTCGKVVYLAAAHRGLRNTMTRYSVKGELHSAHAPADAGVPRYVSHFATCPQAAAHRKRA
jgi:hypothetical protein